MALIRSGDEARLRTYVDASFSKSMRKAGPGDPGIRPFLMDLAHRHRGFDVLRTIAPAPDSVVAVIRSVAQPTRIFRFNLTVDKAPPHLVLGLFILPAQAEDLPKETVTLTPAEAIETYGKEVDRLAGSGEFSGVVLLARGNEVVLQKTAGEADRANHIPNTNDTVFGLASMNKMFTAVAVAKLVEQLLTHTSGLEDYLDQIETDPKLRSARSLSAYRELVRASKIEGKPEDGMRYSNTGYVVLGAFIETVSGRDDFEFVRSEGTRGTSAGGGMSTAGDLFRFARALTMGKLAPRGGSYSVTRATSP